MYAGSSVLAKHAGSAHCVGGCAEFKGRVRVVNRTVRRDTGVTRRRIVSRVLTCGEVWFGIGQIGK